MRRVPIDTGESYDVLLGDGLLSKAGPLLAQNGIAPCAAAVLTDETVDALYADTLCASLEKSGFRAVKYAFPGGEENKNLSTIENILEFLGEHQLTRSGIVIALGGGVVGDMAGFAAAVYLRGVRCVQIPTTLLAAVDSSVGGKTAVDLRCGKNMAGCFHQPSLVLIDTNILSALPKALLSEGAAEIIKYGILYSPELFEKMRGDWLSRLSEIVEICVSLKRDAVVGDEEDRGKRQFLNLGHTFGHAVEAASGYTVSHGRAVAMGLVLAAAQTDRALCRDVISVCRANGLPVLPSFDAKTLAKAALSDKKRSGDSLWIILPEKIGRCRREKIKTEELEELFAASLHTAGELV